MDVLSDHVQAGNTRFIELKQIWWHGSLIRVSHRVGQFLLEGIATVVHAERRSCLSFLGMPQLSSRIGLPRKYKWPYFLLEAAILLLSLYTLPNI